MHDIPFVTSYDNYSAPNDVPGYTSDGGVSLVSSFSLLISQSGISTFPGLPMIKSLGHWMRAAWYRIR